MKILKLTYNEILKQTKKRGFKICLIVLMLFAIGIPVLYRTFTYGETFYPLYCDQNINEYEGQIIKNPQTDQDKLHNKLIETKLEAIKTAIKKDEPSSEFKVTLYDKYITTKRMSIIIDSILLKENINYQNIDQLFELNSSEYQNLQKDQLKEIKSNLSTTIEQLEQVVVTGDYSWYLKGKRNELKDVTNDDINNKKILDIYNKLIELGVKNENDFRAKEAENIINLYHERAEKVTKQEFDNTDNNLTYEEYSKLIDMKNKEVDNNIKKSIYAIENNINYNKEGAKTSLNNSVETNIVILSIVIVIIAGGIVANEFQKETIRLLVIRPNKRWKIILSKFLAVVTITLGLALITYIASFITNGIVYGFSEYLIPDLQVVGSKIVKENFILNSIGNTLFLLIPIIFVGLGAFFLSTITNNTAFSVGFSIFILMGSDLAIMILSIIGFPFVDLTFLPYMDFTQFIDKMKLFSNCNMYEAYYTLKEAILVLTIWGVVIYTISNIVFSRRDIKN